MNIKKENVEMNHKERMAWLKKEMPTISKVWQEKFENDFSCKPEGKDLYYYAGNEKVLKVYDCAFTSEKSILKTWDYLSMLMGQGYFFLLVGFEEMNSECASKFLECILARHKDLLTGFLKNWEKNQGLWKADREEFLRTHPTNKFETRMNDG